MPIHRYFSDGPLEKGQEIALPHDESRHLYKVARARIGDSVQLTNGNGALASGLVVEVDRDTSRLRIESVETKKRATPRRILAQGVPRTPKLDLIVEKGTELGIDTFWFFPGEKSERKNPLSDHQMERLHRIAISSLKQGGRLFLPEIEWVPPIEEWQHLPNVAFFGDLREDARPLLELLPKSVHMEEIAVVIGPESGFTEAERAHLKELGALGASLHHHTLRTDTAALVAYSVIEAHLSILPR